MTQLPPLEAHGIVIEVIVVTITYTSFCGGFAFFLKECCPFNYCTQVRTAALPPYSSSTRKTLQSAVCRRLTFTDLVHLLFAPKSSVLFLLKIMKKYASYFKVGYLILCSY